MDAKDLESAVRAWIAGDPDPVTRGELAGLLAQGDAEALRARFAEPLGFGTAGLRGELGAGPGRMNRAVVARTTAGLCAHLAASVEDARERGLCVGFDARHGSRDFTHEAAAVARGAGFRVHLLEAPAPTPLLAFATRALGAAAGAMVTASHNPARDNGFKVYWQDGIQLTAPHDAAVASAADAAGPASALPHAAAAPTEAPVLDAMAARYLDQVIGPASSDAELRIAYTAMHGVGDALARRALARAGFHDVHGVASQATPDPDFPTVAFPNPEEPGAMDRLLALADEVGAELALAHDPDADRLAAATRASDGALVRLTGNDLGAILCDALLEASDAERPLVVASLVSTPLAERIARAHGARFETTLTGFKWIERRALELAEQDGRQLVLGFEEALGYAVSEAVRDKDGISAAVALARLAARERAAGRPLIDRLHDLWRRHGVHLSDQRSLRLEGVDGNRQRAERMRALREAPPASVDGVEVAAIRDLSRGERQVVGGAREPLPLPPSDVLVWELVDGSRIIVRPSGTEPKIKLYVDVAEPVDAAEAVVDARGRAEARLSALTRAGEALLLGA